MQPSIPNQPTVVIAGGSGFIGRALAQKLNGHGMRPILLSRSPAPTRSNTHLVPAASAPDVVQWNFDSIEAWAPCLEGAIAVINLAGKSVDCAPTDVNLAEIRRSRVRSTEVLGQAIARCQRPPAVWVQASSLAFYANAGDAIVEENAPLGSDVLAGICRDWESAHVQACPASVRQVTLRIGIVLGRDGGALVPLRRLTLWGLGGAAGDGRQYMSWIHLEDMVRLLEYAVREPSMRGAFNACAPYPVTNAEFMREMRRVLKRPWVPPAPVFAIRIAARLMGTNPELILKGWRAVPAQALAAGFRFQYPMLPAALEHLLKTG